MSNLDPPIHTRGPILFFSQFHFFRLILESKIFSFQRRCSDVLATFARTSLEHSSLEHN